MLFDDPALLKLKEKFESAKVRKEGMVRASERGFGFLETPDRESYFITPVHMKNLLHGDRVTCVIETEADGKTKAVPETLTESALKRFTGRLTLSTDHKGKRRLSVVPDTPTIKTAITVDDKRADRRTELKNGDFVICNLKKHALKDGAFRATLDEFVCRGDDPVAPWTVSLRDLDLPLTCPQAPADLTFHGDESTYTDLTALPFVTIDAEKTEDMDDALYLEKEGENFILYVAIADPTSYIPEDSELDKEAAKRAFSIYLPGRNIPMLPRELSDDICSLREGEKRPALVGKVFVSADGAIDTERTEFCLAHIVSRGKLIYNEVSDFLERGSSENFKPDATIAEVLSRLVEFTKARDHYRCTHAAPFRNRPDYEFVLNEAGALDHIEVEYRRIANQIVEESMIAANLACGAMLARHFKAGVFNIHKGFDLKESKEILELLENEGYTGATAESIATLEGFSAVRRYAAGLESSYLDNRMRRLQEYSQISIVPGAHFALGVENYATWTSPIRKYGDMVNHRLLKALVRHPEVAGAPSGVKLPDENTLATMNLARRTNRMAERDVRDWLYVDYLEPEIAKKTVFNGEVFDVVRGGLRVMLTENGAMLFVPLSLISADKTAAEASNATGELLVNGQCALRLGDPLKVRVVEVNKTTRSLVGAPAESVGGLILPDPEKQLRERH